LEREQKEERETERQEGNRRTEAETNGNGK